MGDQRVVKWLPGWTEQDFMAAVVTAGGLAPGTVVELDYAHDGDCPRLAGGACRCAPDVTATIRPARSPRAA